MKSCLVLTFSQFPQNRHLPKGFYMYMYVPLFLIWLTRSSKKFTV